MICLLEEIKEIIEKKETKEEKVAQEKATQFEIKD